MIARWRLLWRALTRRRRFERELEDELEFHRLARQDELVAQGVAPHEAARRARIELGAQELHRDAVRRARGLAPFDALAQDLRYAWRGLLRHRGYSVTALGVLSLAIAANALLFALFNAYALRNPPIDRVERWVAVDSQNQRMRVLDRWSVEDADALLRDPPALFEGLYGFRSLRLPVLAEVARTVSAEAVSDNYFELLGVAPAFGRAFASRDARESTPTVVLSDLGWRRLLDADPAVLGRRIELAGRSFEVIGVMPPAFTGLTVNSSLLWLRERDFRTLDLVREVHPLQIDVGGFLRDGASAAEAAATLAPRVLEANAGKDESLRLSALRVEPRRGYLRADEVSELMMVGIPAAVAFALLLLVAAANLANLVLARFAARQQELAIRVAVGAPRARLVAQLLTECALLAALAATLGFALAAAALAPVNAALFGLMGELGYDMIGVGIDLRVFGYGLVLALLAGIAFGGMPALMAVAPWRRDPDRNALQRAATSRLRSMLMVAQLGASVLLLVLASLSAMNARRAEQLAIGYDPGRIVSIGVDAPSPALADTFARLPQVEAVAGSSHIPLLRPGTPLDVRVGEQSHALAARVVDAGYFAVLDLAARQGRALQRRDQDGSRVVVLSRRTAERLWPGEGAVGRSLDVAPHEAFAGVPAGRYEVVGVVDDVVSGWFIGGSDASALYFPGAIGGADVGSLLLRLRDTSPATREALRRTCAEAAPTQTCELLPLTDAYRLQRLPFLVAAHAAGALGWAALVISCLGLYGLVSYLVLQRRREIGVRLALGAQADRVAREMLRGAARQIGWGLALGLPLAFALSRALASLSQHLRSFDLASFVAVPLLLAALALAAAWIPARRAAAIAPTQALRED